MSEILKVGKYEFNSRLIVGSGKYADFQTTKDATIASGSELITVAIRRVNITNPNNSIDLLIIKFKLILANFFISINNESN